MSKTCFTIAEQKQNVINFIKKHYDILCLDEGRKAITSEYFDKIEKSNTNEFMRLATDIQFKFGSNFCVFKDNRDNRHHTLAIWLPATFCKVASDKAIKKFCGDHSLNEVIEDHYCSWYNMTPKRWEAFEALFDCYDKQKSSEKIVKLSEMKLSDSARLKDDIVF